MSCKIQRAFINVAAAAIVNANNQVLLALRPAHLHQGNKWEFPGGKFELGETAAEALLRELKEELGIAVTSFSPLITLEHYYDDKSVRLHVYKVTAFKGHPSGKENQELRWVPESELKHYQFPDANYPIIKALTFPKTYVITPDFAWFDGNEDAVVSYVMQQAMFGRKLIQLRLPDATNERYIRIAAELTQRISETGATLILNRTLEVMSTLTNVGWHLSTSVIATICAERFQQHRPMLVSASCHNTHEWQSLSPLKPDIVLVSPVNKTASHPESLCLGWHGFAALVSKMNCPAYALGGVTEEDVVRATKHGGQGIAGIRCFYESDKSR